MTRYHQCPPVDPSGPRRVACLTETPTTYTAADAARVGIRAGDDWPYGPNICQDMRNELVCWATSEGLKLADPKARCLHWLTFEARRCRALTNRYGHAGVIDPMREMDHSTFWARDGRPALILAQPYRAPADEWVRSITAGWPVSVEVAQAGPWYGYGTLGVLIAPNWSAA